ncbi:type IV toxin-antitoxin system AbiEi family antitoxin domain-containing protein [Paenibacillus rhizoplanae]|uniref:type IV toxin-antitoxin system AbiEi family antitoxin domain-containing protein n=1 Tax=Paenibacillus rhizoplanae TaxID=1917181 RepID=UPI00361D58C9
MNEQIVTRAMRVLEKHNGFARTRDFLEAGISPYYVKKLESIGEIERVNKEFIGLRARETNQ